MEQHQAEGFIKRARGRVRRAVGRLTGNEVTESRGTLDMILGSLQRRYGQTKEAAARGFNRAVDRFDRYGGRARRARDEQRASPPPPASSSSFGGPELP